MFHNLRDALKTYANRPGGAAGAALPVQPKAVLLKALRVAIEDAEAMVLAAGVDPKEHTGVTVAQRIAKRDAAKEALLYPEDRRKNFLAQVNLVDRIFSAMVLDEAVEPFALRHGFLTDVAGFMRASMERPDVTAYVDKVRAMLSESVKVHRVADRWTPTYEQAPIDLRRLDFEGLSRKLSQQTPNAKALSLQAVVRRALDSLLRANPTRAELQRRFEELVERYNDGLDNAEEFFKKAIAFLETEAKPEATRAEREGVTEEELAFRDVLERAVGEGMRDTLTAIARQLPAELASVMVLDWKLHQPSRDRVRAKVKRMLEAALPEDVSDDAYLAAVNGLYQWLLSMGSAG